MPFVKGDPRINRAGRPKGAVGDVITSKFRSFLEKRVKEVDLDGKVITAERLDFILASMYKEATKGNTRATELLLERGYGRVPTENKVDVSTSQGPIEITSDVVALAKEALERGRNL